MSGWRIALFFLLLAPSVARAETEDAKTHFTRAEVAYGLGRFAEAADEYEKVFGLKPQPALLYDAAQAHRLAGNKQRALLLYQNYLRLYGTQIANRNEVDARIAELTEAIKSDTAIATSSPTAVRPPTQPLAADAPVSVRAEPERPPSPSSIVATPVTAPVAVDARPPIVEGSPAVSTAAPMTTDEPHRRTLWYVVGVVAAVVVVGAVVGIVLATGGGESPPAGERVIGLTF